MSNDLLEQRLQNLVVETPDARRITARVLSSGRQRRARRVPRVASLGGATVALLLLIAYFVPAADAVLADAPIAGNLLQEAGLTGAAGRITSVGAVADSSGYRLKLVGAYADSTRTVLLLQAQPAILPLEEFSVLTDQFGRTYQMHGGYSNSLTGDVIVEFDPLAWPDSITGARITLHVTSVGPACDTTPQCAQPPAPGNVARVSGSWTLPAILGVDEGTALPLPAPATIGRAHVRFTFVAYTPATIAIDMEVTGVTYADLVRIIPDGLKGKPAFTSELVDPGGRIISRSGETLDDVSGTVHVRFLAYRLGGGGDFVFRVSFAGEGQFERVLHVP